MPVTAPLRAPATAPPYRAAVTLCLRHAPSPCRSSRIPVRRSSTYSSAHASAHHGAPHTPPGATLDIFVGADPNQGLSTRAAAAPALAAAPAAPAAGTARDDTVHIFSLASGLLYERFLRIMMKTAVERASRPLKFWILGNFLSPAFRHAVNSGALASAVGAQVIASLIRWRSCSTTGHLIAYVFVCV